MLICIMTVMAQKTFPCFMMSWGYIDFKISKFLNRPLRDSCLLRTLFCIAWFLVRFNMHSGHLTFWGASPMYPLSASYLLNSSNQWVKPLQRISMSGYLPAAYGPLTHTIFLARISTPILYRNPQSPWNLNKEKGFPGMAGPCCGMCTSVPSTLMRQSFRLLLSFLLSRTILRI